MKSNSSQTSPTKTHLSFSSLGRWIDNHWRVLVAAVGSASIAFGGHMLRSQPNVTIWQFVFGAGILCAIVGSILVYAEQKNNKSLREEIRRLEEEIVIGRGRRIFFVIAALTEEWQLELEQHLLNELRHNELEPTVFVPIGNYLAVEQDNHFREILRHKDDYAGGLVVSMFPEKRSAKLLSFASEFNKPVVFIDNVSFESDTKYLPHVGYVGTSAKEGGKLAAQAVVECSEEIKIQRILVIAGTTQLARQNTFKQIVIENMPDCEIVIDEDGNFDRETSRLVTLLRIKDSLRRKAPFQLIFCTTDSMTLGCLDALNQISDWQGYEKPRVIGHDGIVATKKLVNTEDSPLIRIVVQEPMEVAGEAVQELVKLLEGKRNREPIWIQPYLYPRAKWRLSNS
jgi:ABC-type sugar transport system substrate-binding protein